MNSIMKTKSLISLFLVSVCFAQGKEAVSLFNGKDLTGWGFRAKKTFKPKGNFDGKKASLDMEMTPSGKLVDPHEERLIALRGQEQIYD